MAENKTQPTTTTPEEYLDSLDEKRSVDGHALLRIMRNATGETGTMWGPSIVGFGSYHYKYASGREGDSPKVGFSPRKAALVLYGLVFYDDNEPNNILLSDLGPHSRGKGCLYIKSLDSVNQKILEEMIRNSYARGDYDAGNS